MAVPNKTAHTGIRTTPARKEIWREAAEREGLRLSEWLRKLADKESRTVVGNSR